MKIQKGMVKYKDRNDIICMYGVTDAGKTYYFLDSSDAKLFSNSNRVVSTELVEAIDSMVKASKVGVIDAEGNEVIACENKGIKQILDDVVLVEKANPTTQSVLDAINNRNDSLHAAQLVSTPAQIKDNIYKQMGTDGRFLFNDQFSEATICDINGNNLVNNEVYSFIAINNGTVYMSKNLPDSPVEHLILNNEKTEEFTETQNVDETLTEEVTVPQNVENNVTEEVSNSESIDVNNVNVPIEDVENALEGQSLAPGNENIIQQNFDTDISTPLDNVNEGLSIPSSDDFLAATNLGAGLPVVEEDNNVVDTAENTVENKDDTQVTNEVATDEVENKEDSVATEEVAPIDDISTEEVSNVKEVEGIAPVEEENNVSDTDAVQNEVTPVDEVKDEVQPVQEDVAPIDELNENQEPVQDEVSPVEEVNEVVKEVQEDVAPIEDVQENVESVEEGVVPTENSNNQVEQEDLNVDNETHVDIFADSIMAEKDVNTYSEIDNTFTSNEEKEDILSEEDIQSLLDRTSLDLFNGGPLQIDSIMNDGEEFDPYTVGAHEKKSSDNLFDDLAKSMTGLIKQNRDQRTTIANYESVIKTLHTSKNELRTRVSEVEHYNTELVDRNRSLENAVIKLKTRIELLTTKLNEKDDRIVKQAAELERLRPQLEGREQLLGLLKDAQVLIGSDTVVDDIDEYAYSKVV